MSRAIRVWIVPAVLLAGALTVTAVMTTGGGERPAGVDKRADPASAERVERGRYLARVGNCTGCHTEPGGEPLAGGLALETDFGTFRTPNITPDGSTGIGDWSREQFRDAMLRGQRADGAPLYPACPYPSFTHTRVEDIDAIHAWIQSIDPVTHETRDHDLDFPYGIRGLVNVWQWAFFQPASLDNAGDRDEQWHRGRYLVEGLGHCSECHRDRGTFGAVREAVDAPGGMIHGWYAPSLNSPDEAGLQQWSTAEAADFLRSGKGNDSAMVGPMAGVVFDSLQYLRPDDARAMAEYLRALPTAEIEASGYRPRPSPETVKAMMERGERLYGRDCADCHGDAGEGDDGVAALAGNRAVTMENPANIVRMIRRGGFPASTPGNPYPHGMPPFQQYGDRDIASVATYIRQSWGNEAPPVSTIGLAE
ncbi:c-type cytochrome [Halofilum ochraceum]|uniref:c-type cytochrome n=1 Tax=Halofilum ochraceum TaxID=1611323 RepID=UPI00082BACB2|nr:cytochrome c [Halofilum ochraceum]